MNIPLRVLQQWCDVLPTVNTDNPALSRRGGICFNLHRLSRSKYAETYGEEKIVLVYQFVSTSAGSWPKWSGLRKFPVPHPCLRPSDAFHDTLDLWAGQYGENRRDLVRHLIECVKTEISKQGVNP